MQYFKNQQMQLTQYFALNNHQTNRMCQLRLKSGYLFKKTRIEDVPRASIGDEQVVAGNAVVDCIFLGNLSDIH